MKRRKRVSQKVIDDRTLTIFVLLCLLFSPMDVVLRRRIEDIEIPFARVTHLQHTSQIATAVAVVGRAPHRAQPVIVQNLVALLAQLVSAQDVRHAIDLEELAHDLRAEGVPGPARRQRELVALGVRVRPDQVGHGALVGDLAEAVDDLDLVDGVDGGRQTAVDAEDLVVDHHAQREEVEHVREVVPDIGVAVFARALCVEPVRLCHTAGLVVPADEVHALRVPQFQAHEERDRLHAEQAAVHVIAYREVESVRLS